MSAHGRRLHMRARATPEEKDRLLQAKMDENDRHDQEAFVLAKHLGVSL